MPPSKGPNPSTNIFNVSYCAKTPLSGTVELTKNCNLSCVHCYIVSKKNNRRELSTAQVKKLLRQLADEGTLYLVLTGGEVFLRTDIIEICSYARKLNFDLRIFTNATLISGKQIQQLASLNISAVEISLYGREKTHDRITGLPGSFNKCLSAAKELLRHGVPVALKTPLMRGNVKDYSFLSKLAAQIGASLKVDPTITPAEDGSKNILKHRADDKMLEKIYPKNKRSPQIGYDTSDLLCSAGHNFFAVNSKGDILPCLQLPLVLGNIKNQSFKSVWRDSAVLNNLRGLKSDSVKICSNCPDAPYCQRCPGLALTEDGDMFGPSSIACRLVRIMTGRHSS